MALKEKHSILFVCFVGWLFDFYDLALISYLLPQIAKSFQLSQTQETWLLGAALGASGIGGIFFGWLADHFGRKRVMIWTILLYSLGTGFSALVQNALGFIILRAIAGLGIGGEWAVGHALVAETVDTGERGRAAAFLQSGEPIGVALAAIMGFVVSSFLGWRGVLLVSGSTALWTLMVRRHVKESPLWERAHRGRVHTPIKHLGKLISLGLRAFLLATFKLGTYWTCYVWLPKLFVTRFHEPISRSALWILTSQTGQLLGMQYFGRFSDRVGRRLAFAVFSAITAAALFMLMMYWPWLLEHRMIFWVVMFFLGFGSGCTAGFGVLLAELFPIAIRNVAMGTVYNSARALQFFAPFVVMMAMSRWDVKGALAVPFVLAILTGLWVWTLPETRGRSLSA